MVGFNFDGIPGDMGDGRLNNYFLEHGYLYMTGNVNSYWDAPFFYPERSTMSMSDNLFGTLPLYAAFRIMNFDRETSYQIWVLVLLALNFITCFICLKKLKISPVASAVGAYIFAFSLPVVGGLGHIQMLPKFAFPIIMYCLIRFMQDKKSKHLFFFFLLIVYQMYCGIYLGFMSFLASFIVFFIMLFSNGFKTEIRSLVIFFKKHWISSSIFFVLNLLFLFILLRPYVTRSGQVERDYGDIGNGLPTPASYLYPTKNTLLYDWLRPVENYLSNAHEHTLFMGLSCIVAIVLGIYLWKSKKDTRIKFWLLSFLLMILITLNFYYHISFYAIVYLIPGFEAVRAVSRIVQIELFFLGGLIAVIIDHVLKKKWTASKRNLVVGAIVLFVFADQFVWKSGLNLYSKSDSQQRITKLKEELKQQNCQRYNYFAYLPLSHHEVYKFHVDAMLASQDLRIPTINGYSAFSPKEYEAFFEHPDRQRLNKMVDDHVIPTKVLLIVEY